jgi:hypothetical protein
MSRRLSLRAQARRNYRALAPVAPPPKPTRLTKRVRKLYEESAVPVREIAALAGVSERTIYKYAAKHAWKQRYRWRHDRGWRARAKFAALKGAGGRFIARAERGRPFTQGLKAADPQGAALAAARCRQAAALARQAEEAAELRELQEEKLRAIERTTRAFNELCAYRAERAKETPGRAPPADDPVEAAYALAFNMACDRWMALLARLQARMAAAPGDQGRAMGKS